MNPGDISKAIISALPLLALCVNLLFVADIYLHAEHRRALWIILTIITGILGYIFFWFSGDRQK